jgi:hypothetical protein
MCKKNRKRLRDDLHTPEATPHLDTSTRTIQHCNCVRREESEPAVLPKEVEEV